MNTFNLPIFVFKRQRQLIPVSSRPAWPTKRVPGQLGLLHRENLWRVEGQERNERKEKEVTSLDIDWSQALCVFQINFLSPGLHAYQAIYIELYLQSCFFASSGNEIQDLTGSSKNS